jgi:hypothetical protein
MAKTIETIATINSAVRTGLAVVVCGAMATGGYYGYSVYNEKEIATRAAELKLREKEKELSDAQKEISSKTVEIAKQATEITEHKATIVKQDKQINKLETSLRLLKVDHRVARLNILEQTKDANDQVVNKIEFVELNLEGQPIASPRQFEVKGEIVYVDGLVVKFDDKYVEAADLDRSTSLFVFKRIYSDTQNPRDGFPLDTVGSQPLAYSRGGKPSEFEQRIWDDFWSVANDRQKAEMLGIRAAHGEAVSIKPERGLSYRLELRASGGLTVKPDGRAPTSVFREGV